MQFSRDPLNLTNKHSRKVSFDQMSDLDIFCIAYNLSSMLDF